MLFRSLFDVAMGAADAFSPLKATLGAISAVYTNYNVRLLPFVSNALLTYLVQETIAVREKIRRLCSRMEALETTFETPSDDGAEQMRRNELLQYVIASPLDSRLSSSQEVQGHRRTTTASVRKVGAAAIC